MTETVERKLFAETSHAGSQFVEYKPLKETRIQVLDCEAEHLQLKVGTVEIDLNGIGRGTVKVDGNSVSCRAFSINYDASEGPPLIRLEIFPL